MWHFDLNKYRESEKARVKVSLAAVFAFMAIGWPAIVYFTGITGWLKFWLMPWLGYHFWVCIFLTLYTLMFPLSLTVELLCCRSIQCTCKFDSHICTTAYAEVVYNVNHVVFCYPLGLIVD